MVAPFLVQLHQLVELRLKIVRGRFDTLFRGRLERRLFRRVILCRCRLVVLQFGFRCGDFLEHGILLQFMLDHRLEFKRRRLEQCQRMLQLR